MFGPWKKIAEPYGKMVLGYFGKTPVPPDPEIVKTASEQLGLEPTTRAPLEINDEDPNKGVEPARKALQAEGLEETDENVFIAAACKEKGIDFLKGEAKVGVRLLEKSADEPATESSETGKYVVSVNGRDYRLAIDGNQATVNGVAYQVGLKPDEAGDGPAAPPTGKTSPVTAEMPGVVLRLLVAPGDPIQKGDALLVLEAMKMEVHINAPSAGIVAEMSVSIGDQVTTGQVLATIG
jgi:pyruvate carboxylase subunit B